MKLPLILILGFLIFLALPSGVAGALTAGLSSGGGLAGAPTENVSFYISDAKAAVAERNWTSALLLTTRGIAWYPDNADLLCLQGYTYRKMGQYQKSVDVVSKGIQIDPTPVRYANRGYGYLALGDYPEALADAESGISLTETYPTAWGVKALALQGLGRNTEALAAIERAIEADPESAHYWHIKGVILVADADCAGARNAMETSIRIDPDYNLPYPGFAGAREDMAALSSTCTPAPALPAPTKSSSGGFAVVGILCAIIVIGMRK